MIVAHHTAVGDHPWVDIPQFTGISGICTGPFYYEFSALIRAPYDRIVAMVNEINRIYQRFWQLLLVMALLLILTFKSGGILAVIIITVLGRMFFVRLLHNLLLAKCASINRRISTQLVSFSILRLFSAHDWWNPFKESTFVLRITDMKGVAVSKSTNRPNFSIVDVLSVSPHAVSMPQLLVSP